MSIKHAILGLLHYKDMHGYQIKNHIEENFGSMWTVNFGQIYTTLKTLVDAGDIVLIDVLPSDSGAPHRKLYSLTDKGRKEFKDWLKSSPEKGLLLRDPFMMRFIFFGFGEKEEALRLIDEQIQLTDQRIARRKESMPRWKNRGFYPVMARELGLSYAEVYLQWLRKIRARVEKGKFQKSELTGAIEKMARRKPIQRL